jgi:hypothetical protein
VIAVANGRRRVERREQEEEEELWRKVYGRS